MVRMESENPRYRFVQPEARIIDDEPGVPSGPRTPSTPTDPKTDKPLLPFEDRDLQPILDRPYRLVVSSYNSVINRINTQNKTLYEHETAYNKGDYSFAGGNKSTAQSIIANDKQKLQELETQRKNLELELRRSERQDSVGANKYKGNLLKYESYENYKKRMDEANKANGTDDASSTGGTESTGVINTDKKEYRLPADKKEFIDLLVGLGLAQYFPNNNGKSDTLNMLYTLKNGELVKSGNANSSDYWFAQYGNNSEFMSALDKFAQGAGWSKTGSTGSTGSTGNVNGTDGSSSLGGTEEDSILQGLNAEQQKLQNELDVLNDEINTLNGEINALNGEMTTLSNDINSLNTQKLALETKKKSLENEINKLKSQLEKANEDLDEIQAKINLFRHNPMMYKPLLDNREQLLNTITSLASSIASKTSELSSIDSQIAHKQQEITAKQQEINNKQQEINNKQQEINNKQQEITAKQKEINNKQGEVDGKQGEVDHRNTYVENNSDGSKMRFDTDYGVKDTSNDTTDGSLQTYLKQIKDNNGVPNDSQKQQLINLLTQYGVSNAEAYINKLLEGDGKITDTEIRNLLASLKDRINGNGQGNSYDKMINYIFPTTNTNKSDTKALEKAIKDMGLRETNCKGVYCEQHNPSMPKGNYTHQRHYVWDPVNQKMVLLKDKSGNELYYISSNGNEAKSNEHLNKWLNGTYDYRLVHTGMDGKTTGYYGGPNGTNGTGGTESNTTIKTNAEKAKNILANAPNYGDISSAIASKNLGNICTRIGNTLGVYGISIDKDFNGARDAFGSAGQKLLGAINSNNNGQMTNEKSAAISDYTSKLSALLAQINKLLK